MVRRGLAPSRERAQADIASGRVLVGGVVADKPARQVGADQAIVVQGPPARFVGRGGEKLDGALDRFGIDVRDRRGIDCGASTGGFTDCLLQRGAREVVAIDVGYGQLHERLDGDERVVVFDRTNLRHVVPDAVGGPGDVVVADLSFISLRVVLDALLGLARPDADVVVLVKPQFEAGRAEASKGRGIITDPAVWRRVLDEVIAAFTDRGACIMGAMVSPITGSDGNVEFLLHARPGAPSVPVDTRSLVDEVLADAVAVRTAAGTRA
jgi:23S rRNA (cytidine1920-2'-O)/16S rRNA (cytidine1409-2'-O)-methyltransferase